MVKVIVCDKLSEEGVKILRDAGFSVDCKYKLPPEELKKIIGEYNAAIVRSDTKFTKDIIEHGHNLKVIGRAGVGLDNVDLEAATKKGIIVMNSPGGNTISTCEHAFAMMLAIARNIPLANISLKSKAWERSKFKGVELYSKTIGIIGLGRIGKEFAKRAQAFGMEVIAMDPFVSEEVAKALGIKMVSLSELLKNSDFITIHTPVTDETKKMISHKEFASMKPKAFIINCARGEVIDEEALYEVLKDKKIAGAALDVFSKEPPFESKLLELDNVVTTPHLGASTEEAQLNVAIEIAYCIKDALLGKAIRNAANYVQLDPETYKIIQPYFELSEKMGKFIAQTVEGGTKEIKLYYLGAVSAYKVDVLTLAFMKGFFSGQLIQDVNYINALEIAKSRGIKIEQIKIAEEEEYVSSIRAKVKTDKSEQVLEGTLFANKEARFVKMDDIYTEVYPSQFMLVINNWDKPGTIGFIGTTLGNHKINIAGMSLGRRAQDNTALTIFNLDNPLNDEVIKAISSNKNIVSLKFVKL
ncbi:MAG: phosphoglycerate dehydrogenase [Candidatus Omnitrophica bacterium]|jgi:D-3-phosphoglycerate dehydrogenase|nr:phosphoglycerate dehydrogenase [Candidatus Omnitrophota bacterium]